MKILERFFPKEKPLSQEEQNLKDLQKEYEAAIKEYHNACDRYRYAANNENEDVLYNAIIISRQRVDNTLKAIKLSEARVTT